MSLWAIKGHEVLLKNYFGGSDMIGAISRGAAVKIAAPAKNGTD